MGQTGDISPGHDPRPASDISAAVGWAGLAGLAGWILICRNWGGIVDAFGLDLPHAPLAGPMAALAAVLFSAGPMVLWAIGIDKVHHRRSTGIAWDARRPLASSWQDSLTKLAGLWVTWLMIAGAYCIARWYWVPPYRFAMEVMGFAALPLLVLSVPYVFWLDRHLLNPRDGAWHFGAMVIGHEPHDPAEVRGHLRIWLVKGFFIAFMISILPQGFAGVVRCDWRALGHDPAAVVDALVEVLFLIDVQIAMGGYLLTLRPLDAQIRSANPSLAGWVAALICYPPFILMGDGGPLDYHTNAGDWTVWLQGHPALQWGWGALLVGLTAIYAWATVAFGLRFSNLTYRGVLTEGPYRFSRHPAYLSKNLFWWLSTLPMFAASHSHVDAARNTAMLGLVSCIYWWRAKTEEAHLAAEDAKYRAYAAWIERHGLLAWPLRQLARLPGWRRPVLTAAE
jgi:protein-S-isoprenylcysteine O-methyltransferase Ste14